MKKPSVILGLLVVLLLCLIPILSLSSDDSESSIAAISSAVDIQAEADAEVLHKAQNIQFPVPPGVSVCQTPTQRACPVSMYWMQVSPRGDMHITTFGDIRVRVAILSVWSDKGTAQLSEAIRVLDIGRIVWLSITSLRKNPRAFSYRYIVPQLSDLPERQRAVPAPLPVLVPVLVGSGVAFCILCAIAMALGRRTAAYAR